MMNVGVFPVGNLYSTLRNTLWKLEDNSSGPEKSNSMESGSDLMKKSSVKSDRSTLTKYISEPSIITIQMTSTPLQSNGQNSNTMINLSSLEETVSGPL